MSVKIRLQRHGKKGKPFYWIVAADARSKRDGKFLEKLGTYNPNTNPATIDLNVDGAVQWLHNGAQPTDTARAILSYKGALMKHHLDGGVRKGALTQEQADAKLAQWLDAKAGKVDAKKDGLSKAKADAREKALKAEKEANEKRAAKAVVVEEEVAEETTEEVVAEVATEEAVSEVAVEETVAEVVAEETTEVEEAPAAEENNEETEA
ncbi:30S ribosomal protein S16 [Flavobacterium capsici]|uniref:Small ribosomal subunit protein bS16 n=1 Tax=Flavobacterium capsici TaxID=3075618 RepID=A0AA96EZ36_9FLAO|nr:MULTISPECIES: 30S ribosomal protein S16 [unclassified Flavobacterium]WNM19914.1 30S ribosomal protein S16 [Flavobacterium sp. PMR2A8]WNM21303.1 30S ribosomal protein S16 [Flavobacterium sp. PMTSA4]